MTSLHEVLQKIRLSRDGEVLPPRGLPTLRDGHRAPADLLEFYGLCGGVRLFERAQYPMRIVGAGELVRSNPEIVGSECPDDITDSWYIVARGGLEEAISVDCGDGRLGRCYDSFWDRHGVAGDCAIVALSFTELLNKLVENKGGYWYWLVDGGPGYGDAYAPSFVSPGFKP